MRYFFLLLVFIYFYAHAGERKCSEKPLESYRDQLASLDEDAPPPNIDPDSFSCVEDEKPVVKPKKRVKK